MSKFKIGDMIRPLRNIDESVSKSTVGKIVEYYEKRNIWFVDFDLSCRYIFEENEIELVEIPKIQPTKKLFKRDNNGKPRYSKLDASFIRGMADAMTKGSYKDNDDGSPNWKNPVENFERDCLDSLWRHVNDVFEGKFVDDDGIPTLIKVANNAMICEFQRLNRK